MFYNDGMSTTLPSFSFSSVSVGQVIYLIPKDAKGVIPALIVEEITRKTTSGSSTSLMVQLPTQTKPVKLDPEAVEIFENLEDVKKILVERATKRISEMINDVEQVASIFQGRADDYEEDVEQTPTFEVTLPDGTKARVTNKKRIS
jgi:hypothetical protein